MNDEILERLDRMETMLQELLGNGKAGYTPVELAKRLGKSAFTVREWCRFGRLNASKTPNDDWKISKTEVERYERDGLLPVQNPAQVRQRLHGSQLVARE